MAAGVGVFALGLAMTSGKPPHALGKKLETEPVVSIVVPKVAEGDESGGGTRLAAAAVSPDPAPIRRKSQDRILPSPEAPEQPARVTETLVQKSEHATDETGSLKALPLARRPAELGEDALIDTAAIGEETVPRKPSSRRASRRAAKAKSKKVRDDVRLRAKPDNGAKAVATIPSGARVKVIGCKAWCEVVYGGKRGFVYRKFVGQ